MMLLADKATAPESAAPRSEQNNPQEGITPEPTPATTCGLCGSLEDLYFVTNGALCVGCIGATVSLAANDLWPDMVRYSREFEAVLM